MIGQKIIPIDPGKPVLAGLCATMHGGETPVVATFDNVSVSSDIVKPAPPAPGPVQAFPGTITIRILAPVTIDEAGGKADRLRDLVFDRMRQELAEIDR